MHRKMRRRSLVCVPCPILLFFLVVASSVAHSSVLQGSATPKLYYSPDDGYAKLHGLPRVKEDEPDCITLPPPSEDDDTVENSSTSRLQPIVEKTVEKFFDRIYHKPPKYPLCQRQRKQYRFNLRAILLMMVRANLHDQKFRSAVTDETLKVALKHVLHEHAMNESKPLLKKRNITLEQQNMDELLRLRLHILKRRLRSKSSIGAVNELLNGATRVKKKQTTKEFLDAIAEPVMEAHEIERVIEAKERNASALRNDIALMKAEMKKNALWMENHHENMQEKEKYLRTAEELDEHRSRRIEASQILPNNRKRLQRL